MQSSRTRRLIGARSALFAEADEEEGESAHGDGKQLKYDEFARDVVEEKFEKTTGELRTGMADLKDISIVIQDHLEEDNLTLTEMSAQMDTANTGVTKSRGRLSELGEQKSTRHMCILILFILGVFFCLWFLYKAALAK